MFALGGKAPGIKVGVSISTLVKKRGSPRGDAEVLYRDFAEARADERRKAMLAALGGTASAARAYETVHPLPEIGFPFKSRATGEEFFAWPSLPELFPVAYPGVSTARDDFLVDIDAEALAERVALYFNPEVDDASVAAISAKVMTSTKRYDPRAVRSTLLGRGLGSGAIVPFAYRPWDTRHLYWDPDTKLLDEKRPELYGNRAAGTWYLVAQQKPRREWSRPQVVTALGCLDLMDRGAQFIPAEIHQSSGLVLELGDRPNLTPHAMSYCVEHGTGADDLFRHALAILHSPAYANENEGALRQDWARIPLPREHASLEASVATGAAIASLLDPLRPAPETAQTAGSFARLSRVGGGSLLPAELAVTAHWGIAGKGGITMPSTGKLTARPYTDDELAAIAEHAESLGVSRDEAIDLLGETCFDVYLNDVAYWRCVPANVWRYTIGGYQVIKKWLSYRERALLGRDLKPEEARYVTEMVRRIAALVLMQPELDANYERVKADAWEWGKQPSASRRRHCRLT